MVNYELLHLFYLVDLYIYQLIYQSIIHIFSHIIIPNLIWIQLKDAEPHSYIYYSLQSIQNKLSFFLIFQKNIQ